MKTQSRDNQYKLAMIMSGVANHRRVQIIDLVAEKEPISILDIAEALHVDFRTISHHVSKLAQSGSVLKHFEGNMVLVTLSEQGKSILKFLRTLE